MFCQPPSFDINELWDESFPFFVCSGRSEFLSCQLLPCDVIVMTIGHANCERVKSCSAQFRQRPPLLIVMTDDPTAVPEYMHPAATVPERATASKVMAALRNLPKR
jgi:hypothetical protein